MRSLKTYDGVNVLYPENQNEYNELSSGNIPELGLFPKPNKLYWYGVRWRNYVGDIKAAERGYLAFLKFGNYDQNGRKINFCFQDYEGNFLSPSNFNNWQFGTNAIEDFMEQNNYKRVVFFRTSEDVRETRNEKF